MGPQKPKSMKGRLFNCAGSVSGLASCRTKSGDAQRKSSRSEHLPRDQRRILQRPGAEHHVEPVLDRVDHVVHQPDVQPRVGIALQERGADPGRVVDADEDRYRDPQLALRLLPAALDQRANAVGLGQDVHGVVVDLLAEVGDGELMGVLAQQLDAEVGLRACVSLRLTVDLGMPSNAAAFDRLRLSTTLPNTSRASRSKGRFCSMRVTRPRVPNMQQGVAVLHLFRPFQQLLRRRPEEEGLMSHRQPW